MNTSQVQLSDNSALVHALPSGHLVPFVLVTAIFLLRGFQIVGIGTSVTGMALITWWVSHYHRTDSNRRIERAKEINATLERTE